MDALSSMIFCICGSDDDNFRNDVGSAPFVLGRKPRPHQSPLSDSSRRSAETIVDDVISILRSAEKDGVELAKRVDDSVGAKGWTEWIAEGVLNGIKAILEEGQEKMGSALKVAYDRASEAADASFQFTKDHPEVMSGMLTIIAVGILVLLAPAFVEALGFAELGPIEGTLFPMLKLRHIGSMLTLFQQVHLLPGGKAPMPGTSRKARCSRSFSAWECSGDELGNKPSS